jgi:hypothetical protein
VCNGRDLSIFLIIDPTIPNIKLDDIDLRVKNRAHSK